MPHWMPLEFSPDLIGAGHERKRRRIKDGREETKENKSGESKSRFEKISKGGEAGRQE
jgi:hypothetical protein